MKIEGGTEEEEVRRSKVTTMYIRLKPHISLLNDMVVLAKFINTSFSILTLLHPKELVGCSDVETENNIQISARAMENMCDPFTPSNSLYDMYLYTFLFNIGLFIFAIFLSRWHPWIQHAELISAVLVVVTLFMLFSKMFMIFYVPSLSVFFHCEYQTGNFSVPYCTNKMLLVGDPNTTLTRVSCASSCVISPNAEIYMLAGTLVLSFLYICYLVYCYQTAAVEKRKPNNSEVDIVSIIPHDTNNINSGHPNMDNEYVNIDSNIVVSSEGEKIGLLSGKHKGM